MDGTFKIVDSPFKKNGQLMSIHGFFTKDGQRKQFPLVFALMSRRTERDYVLVLNAVKEKLQHTIVENFVLDFEIGAWLAIRRVFPNVTIKGCVFHWTQAVWRHVQEYGLVKAYRELGPVHAYIRQLMALPFLPSSHIRDTFMVLQARANTEQLQKLTNYMQRQWFENSVVSVSDWCVYRLTVRTNNDVEGWHNRLNTAARHGGVPFYVLVPMLRTEAEVVEVIVLSDQFDRDTMHKKGNLEQKINETWDLYSNKDISTTQLLRKVSLMYSPVDN